MAEKGLFFNAFPNDEYETGYDRNYSADDISDMLSVFADTGVVKTNNEDGTGNPLGLKVLAGDGLSVSVNVGKALLKGKGYINNTSLTLAIETAPTGSAPRYDLVILRMDNTQSVNARKAYLLVQEGTTAKPTASDLTRGDDIYDLLLAYIAVRPNATSVQQSDITDTRGDKILCPWFTAVKGYDDYYDAIVQQFESNVTMQSAGKYAESDLATSLYNEKYSLIEVYCNGLKEEDSAYSVDTGGSHIAISFASQKTAGAKISIILSNFIDGEGLSSAIDSYNAWVNDVENLKTANEFNYYCNGKTDNVLISHFVSEKIASGGEVKVNVIGNFGATAPMQGGGTRDNPYAYFYITSDYGGKYTIDFSNCSKLAFLPDSGVTTCIFKNGLRNVEGELPHGHIVGARISAVNEIGGGGTYIQGFKEGFWLVERCEFKIHGWNSCYIANNGTFRDCKGEVINESGYGYCFYPLTGSLLIIDKGEYYSYNTDNTNAVSSIIGLTYNGTALVYGLNAPQVEKTGYYQKNALYQTTGRLVVFGMTSTIPNDVPTATQSTIYGRLSINLPDKQW